jgi:hypothetical protein
MQYSNPYRETGYSEDFVISFDSPGKFQDSNWKKDIEEKSEI